MFRGLVLEGDSGGILIIWAAWGGIRAGLDGFGGVYKGFGGVCKVWGL